MRIEFISWLHGINFGCLAPADMLVVQRSL